MEQTQKFPSEIVELPSKGKLYSSESKLSSGKVEMKYMTAKEEDILTNQSYIEKGIVIDKLIQSLIVDKEIDYKELLVGDKNALLIASRVLGYGKDYEFEYNGEKHTIDLTQLPEPELHTEVEKAQANQFTFKTPATGNTIIFKLLSHGDELEVDKEVKGLKKIHKESSAELSTRLKHIIISVNGESERAKVRAFVDNQFLARDSRALRNYIKQIQPDINLKFYPEDGPQSGVDIPIGVNFLWPDADI